MADGKGSCFVVMAFGKKTDFETGRTLDLDKSYRNVIKPAVGAAGFDCVRADEIVHSGLIDVPMYEHLLAAGIVVADRRPRRPAAPRVNLCSGPCVVDGCYYTRADRKVAGVARRCAAQTLESARLEVNFMLWEER